MTNTALTNLRHLGNGQLHSIRTRSDALIEEGLVSRLHLHNCVSDDELVLLGS